MTGYLNKAIIIGNLGKDPELRYTNDGRRVVSFSVATSYSWRDKTTNERQDKREWHRIIIFNDQLCDLATKFLRKGSKVYLEGQLQTRKWKDHMGHERYTTEIVLQQFRGALILLDSRSEEDSMSDLSEDSLEHYTGELIDLNASVTR